jgi:dTDP-4-dehydrorhamnose reductase
VTSAQPTISCSGRRSARRELAAVLPVAGRRIALDRTGLDLTDPDAIAHMVRSVKPQFVVNAAAYTEVDRAEDEPSAPLR